MTVETRYVPCEEFEQRIHSFVDGETNDAEARTLLVHLELCGGCAEALETVRRAVRLHRDARMAEEVAAAFDSAGFLQGLQRRLVEENLERLAQLFYELGKAYFVAGNDSYLRLYLHKKAASLEKTRSKGRAVVRETARLAAETETIDRERRRSLERARRLLRSGVTRRSGGFARLALAEARRFLRECLRLDPAHHAARIVHAMVLVRVDRLDEAAREYRSLLRRPDLSDAHRVLAWQHLGNLHGMRREYREAVRCYEAALEVGLPAGDERFFHVLLGLAMFRAKAGDFPGSEQAFEQLVRGYPRKLAEARSFLERAPVFRELLATRERFGHRLRRRYPVLFAG